MAEYIEREAAYSLSKKICDAIRNREYHPSTFGHLILDWIDDLPSADVAPVRRGKWMLKQHDDEIDIYNCSCCGLGIWHYPKVLPLSTYGYCPKCGAKMQGGE